jgi:hypothetical protein
VNPVSQVAEECRQERLSMTITREKFEQKATARGYTLHESVTEERLAKINPKMLTGKPERLTDENCVYLDADREQLEQWIADRCFIVPFVLGPVGEEVIGPPATNEEQSLVYLPSFRIVAICDGQGIRTDRDEVSTSEMTFTILRDAP